MQAHDPTTTNQESDAAKASYAPQPPPQPHRDEPGNIRLLTLQSGGWVLLLALLLSIAAAVWLAYIAATHQRIAIGDGEDPATFGFSLDNLALAPEHLITFGQPRDYHPTLDEPMALPALSDPRVEPRHDIYTVNRRMRGKYVVPDDRVVVVEQAGEARAYPLRILAAHEIVNDTLGGVPIAVTYSPIADTVTVYKRPAASDDSDEPLTFGLSGLMVNQGLVMYDRQPGGPNSGEESLWLQITGDAIAGPRSGQTLKRLPAQLVLYRQFIERYAETIRWHDEENDTEETAQVTPTASVMVVEGIAIWARGEDFRPVIDKKYRHFLETYRRDDQTDALQHPVAPLPELAEGERLKDPLVVVFVPGHAEPVVVTHQEVMAKPRQQLVRILEGEITLSFIATRTIHGTTVAVNVDPPDLAEEVGLLHTYRYAWHAAKHRAKASVE